MNDSDESTNNADARISASHLHDLTADPREMAPMSITWSGRAWCRLILNLGLSDARAEGSRRRFSDEKEWELDLEVLMIPVR